MTIAECAGCYRVSAHVTLSMMSPLRPPSRPGPVTDSGPLTAGLVQNGTLKTYHGFPHGMPTTQAETINADLLAFLEA